MSRSRTKTFLLFLLVGSVLTIFPISGQDVDPARSARNIRVKKLALNWQDEVVKLTNTDGTKIKGKLVDANFYHFILEKKDGKITEVPIDQITVVTLSPGIMELSLTVATGLIVGGFAMGFVSLTTSEASAASQGVTALLGALVGSWMGYFTFYQEEVIELE